MVKQGRILWNLAIPATGTKQAIVSLKEFFPVMKPNLVILGFYTNDFWDNLCSLDYHYRLITGLAINKCQLSEDLTPITLSFEEAYFRAIGWPTYSSASSTIKSIALRTRIGSLVKRVKNKFYNTSGDGSKAFDTNERRNRKQLDITRQLLKELHDYVVLNNSELLVLLIPDRQHIKQKFSWYPTAQKLMEDLKIKFIDPSKQLTEEDYSNPPDHHWNSDGHIKVGKIVLSHLPTFLSE